MLVEDRCVSDCADPAVNLDEAALIDHGAVDRA